VDARRPGLAQPGVNRVHERHLTVFHVEHHAALNAQRAKRGLEAARKHPHFSKVASEIGRSVMGIEAARVGQQPNKGLP